MLRIIRLIMLAAAVGVSARVIPNAGNDPIGTPRPLPVITKNHDGCTFRPQSTSHQTSRPSIQSPLDSQNPSSSVPAGAWPHIASLLATRLASKKNSVQTLNLGQHSNDASLEGINLGIVYSYEPQEPPRDDLKIRDKAMMEIERTECVRKSVEDVERRRMMEGVMDVQGGGRISFLVYRVD